MNNVSSPLSKQWQASYQRRQKLYPEKLNSSESVRLVHKEGTPLRIDKLGAIAAMGWWSDKSPTHEEWNEILSFLESIGIKDWVFRHYGRNETADEKKSSVSCPEVWQGLENGILFEFRRNQGHAAGLFLDQRDHRQWLKTNAKDKKILNLFSYTGGFSLYAALGGAQSVTTVDLSAKYIEWSKTNFSINGVSPELPQYKFHAMDSLEFLKYAKRKNLSYDFIICDPPSFSRNKGKDFRIDRDYALLIDAMKDVLEPQGRILFSTNYENWSADIWLDKLQSYCAKNNLFVEKQPHTSFDFESNGAESLMKAFHIQKK